MNACLLPPPRSPTASSLANSTPPTSCRRCSTPPSRKLWPPRSATPPPDIGSAASPRAPGPRGLQLAGGDQLHHGVGELLRRGGAAEVPGADAAPHSGAHAVLDPDRR